MHCWGGIPNSRWYPKTKAELEQKGFEVFIPQMPDTDKPELSKWLPKLIEVSGEANENLYLIGHSLGNPTILRFLEQIPDGVKIGGVVMVAGYTDDLHDVAGIGGQLASFFQTPFNWVKIKNSAKHFVAIHSDNDPYVDLKYGDIFKEKLNAEVIVKHNMGHFSEPDGGGDAIIVKNLPDVTQAIFRMI